MPKKTLSRQQKEEMRARYIIGDYITVESLAELYGVTRSYLYNLKNKEKWDLLKQEVREDSILEAVKAEVNEVINSIDFYEKIKDYCKKKIDEAKKEKVVNQIYKGSNVEVKYTLEPSEIKQLVEAYSQADEKSMLLKSIKLRGEEGDVKE